MLFFSTLLIWREKSVILEEAYIGNQRNNLANVIMKWIEHLQFSIDRMMFFAMGCRRRSNSRLISMYCVRPASAVSQRHQRAAGGAANRRTLPVFGISGGVAGDSQPAPGGRSAWRLMN
ncbi:hypothetical protein MJ561_19130 [Klebsiella pneumoniae]|nr:hypothetical protein MJ561_19130 [Klebsiella pneumoniae]